MAEGAHVPSRHSSSPDPAAAHVGFVLLVAGAVGPVHLDEPFTGVEAARRALTWNVQELELPGRPLLRVLDEDAAQTAADPRWVDVQLVDDQSWFVRRRGRQRQHADDHPGEFGDLRLLLRHEVGSDPLTDIVARVGQHDRRHRVATRAQVERGDRRRIGGLGLTHDDAAGIVRSESAAIPARPASLCAIAPAHGNQRTSGLSPHRRLRLDIVGDEEVTQIEMSVSRGPG